MLLAILSYIKLFLADTSGRVKAKAVGKMSAGVLAASVAVIGTWEGLERTAYRDVVGVWTVCYGETRGVQPGDTYTKEECDLMLEPRIVEFWTGLKNCIPALPNAPASVQVASTSWAYNVGLGAACRSTLAKKLRAGDYRGACEQLPRWNRAGGRVIGGLTNRRVYERRLCLKDL